MLKPSKLLRSSWPKVRPEKKNGSLGYLVDARGNGWTGKTRFFFQKKDEALRKAKELANDYRELGEKGAKFKHENFSLLLSLNLQLQQTREKFNLTNLTFEQVFAGFHSFRENQLKDMQDINNVPRVSEAAKQWFQDKTAKFGGKGGKTLAVESQRELKQIVKILTKDSGFGWQSLNQVTMDRIEHYLKSAKRPDGKPTTMRTRKNRLVKFKQFFNWCMHPKRKWLKTNPCNGIEAYVESHEVEILSNNEVERLLLAAFNDETGRHRVLPWLVFGLFAGLRPTEAERLSWSEIDWSLVGEDGALQVRIDTKKSKTRTHYAELHPAGIEWLKLCTQRSGQIGLSIRAFRRIRKKVGLYDSWKVDCVRHTYASNWLETYKSRGVNTLAELMGNSPEVIRRHYQRALPAGVANQYWKIKPSIQSHDSTQSIAA